MAHKLILIFLVVLSVLSKNKTLAIGAIVVLVLSALRIEKAIDFMNKHFLDLGMIFLMIWMLLPFVGGQNSIKISIRDFLNLRGGISFISGIFVVVLASKGVIFLKGNVDVITGVVAGSLIGVAFLGGVPVGPLIASGLAYEILKIINLFIKNS
jgi:uncharacterized membrane protein (DUF441 family)